MNHIVSGRHGYFLANRYDEYIGLGLIRYGEYAELEWIVLDQLIQPGNTVVEVGANIGSHTVSIAKKTGPDGRFALPFFDGPFKLAVVHDSGFARLGLTRLDQRKWRAL